MRRLGRMLLLALVFGGMPVAWSGCVGYVGGGGDDYAGGVWFHDDVWVDGGGRGWYGRHDGAYIHPHGHDRR